MYSQYPYPEYGSVWNIGVSILLSLLTLGIYGLYWQYKQMLILNASGLFSFRLFVHFIRKDKSRFGDRSYSGES